MIITSTTTEDKITIIIIQLMESRWKVNTNFRQVVPCTRLVGF